MKRFACRKHRAGRGFPSQPFKQRCSGLIGAPSGTWRRIIKAYGDRRTRAWLNKSEWLPRLEERKRSTLCCFRSHLATAMGGNSRESHNPTQLALFALHSTRPIFATAKHQFTDLDLTWLRTKMNTVPSTLYRSRVWPHYTVIPACVEKKNTVKSPDLTPFS